MESKASDASSGNNNLLNLRQLDSSNGNASYPSKKMLKRSDEYVDSSSGLDLQNNIVEDKGTNGAVTQTNVVGPEVVNEGDVVVDAETGQVVRATELAMNMLDVTMPETLSEEQKRKVRTAVAQGETLMTALQGAVPEDVRGKLTSSVTAILQNQKKNSNGVPSVSNVTGVTSVLNPKIQETSEPNASELHKQDTSSAGDSNQPSTKNDASEPHAPTLGTGDSSPIQSTSKEREPNASELDKGDTSSAEDPNKPSTKNDASEPQAPTLGTGNSGKVQSTSHHDGEISSSNESNSSPPGKPERSGNAEDHTNEQAKLGHEDGTKVEKDNQQKDAQP
nr:putative alpha/beta hydrolase fold protein [Tanacetum cinerariifolium]